MTTNDQKSPAWLDRLLFTDIKITWESVLFAGILLLALVSRFYDLGARVISHDETSHVYYSWRLFKGMGYSHTPITHGPLQFHLLAFIFFLLGDSDFTSRLPAAIFSIATIAFLWKYRRYLGKFGTLAAAGMMLISPYMLYYGRYARNEAFVALFGVVTIWAILRYLETRAPRYLYWLTAATVLHFTAKETAFIYTAQAMLFLGFYFVFQITKKAWQKPDYRNLFLVALIIAALFLGIALVGQNVSGPTAPAEGAAAVEETSLEGTSPEETGSVPSLLTITAISIGGLSLLAALLFAIFGYTWEKLKTLPSFSALLLLGTLVLPQLAPFPVRLLGWDPTDYSQAGMLRTGIVVGILAALAIAIGLAWNPKEWLINAAIFYVPFTIFYTTVFTNGTGFFTGLVGSLGYWIEQQGVERGSQPWYYYWLIQVPLYEYLPALVSAFTVVGVGVNGLKKLATFPPEEDENDLPAQKAPVAALLIFWAFTSLIAYTIAGEKMPWLTVHIAFPMILLSGFGIQALISHLKFSECKEKNGWLAALVSLVFLFGIAKVLGGFLGTEPPFQGKELAQLQRTGIFLTTLLITITSGVGLAYLAREWAWRQVATITSLTLILILGVLTTHTAVQAAYINYDNPTEYLVYAHSARGVKEALTQIEELSLRTSDGLAMEVAYDNSTTYPYWWYLRNYENQSYFGEEPTRAQRSAPVILAGSNKYDKLEPVVGQAYYQFDYNRLWWPNQDYFGLTWERVANTLTDPALRESIFQIWLKRDYAQYAEIKGKDMSLPNWSPAEHMRLYVRKDMAAKVWNYGTGQVDLDELTADPYEEKEKNYLIDQTLNGGLFQSPRDVAVAPDGTIYIADSSNHRVVHLSADGETLHTWGTFSAPQGGEGETAAPGTFNEPWGIAVGPDGSVYVADTWNHRVQKFTPAGDFVTTWGRFGQAESPDAFWGPRAVAVDEKGHVYVTDTGNKRIAIFDSDGNFITEFGEVGLGPGQFDEPVGLALDGEGNLYVADTWNQRVQVFEPNEDGLAVIYKTEWDIIGWYGQSLDNKPYLTASEDVIYVSDPEGYRILAFSPEGEFLHYWGTFGEGPTNLNRPTGLAIDAEGNVWVADAGNNRVVRFDMSGNQ
ncbi:MAG: Serine/threonine-protein kinase PknD [Chloroflexi bacterium]|nr:Serine/threonine-protein kinase PknD [Chloroflexota bacterium]